MYIVKNVGIIPVGSKLVKVLVNNEWYYTPETNTLKNKILLRCTLVEKDSNNYSMIVGELTIGAIVTFKSRTEAVKYCKEYDALPATFKVVRSTEKHTVVTASKNKYKTVKVETEYLRYANEGEIKSHNDATSVFIFSRGNIDVEEKA